MKKRVNPYAIIVFSFFCVIIFGTILFCLPISTNDNKGLKVVDALFMTVSSVCVTGLSVLPNVGASLSDFGKIVMAILIEIGGLSFLTIAVFFLILLGQKLGMAGTLMMREALNQNSAMGIKKLVKRIVFLAILIQFLGFIINLFVFVPLYNTKSAIGISAFHSISSFNNAGLDIFGYDTSMIGFSHNLLLNINTIILIVLGGIGFIVIYDVYKGRSWKKISVHSKIVITTTCFLIVLGFILYKILLGDKITWLEALFTSITTRTAGFTTIDMQKLNNSSYILTLFLMFIGASPCSTGGGIKTTTFFVVVIALISISRGKEPNAFHRKISSSSITKAFALVTMSIFLVFIATFCVTIFDPHLDIRSVFFEVVSGFGTVGLSFGITPYLSVGSKIVIATTMFLGRLGPLTIMSVWNKNWLKNTSEEVKYVEEKVIIG